MYVLGCVVAIYSPYYGDVPYEQTGLADVFTPLYIN